MQPDPEDNVENMRGRADRGGDNSEDCLEAQKIRSVKCLLDVKHGALSESRSS